jgi:hypothetical protein
VKLDYDHACALELCHEKNTTSHRRWCMHHNDDQSIWAVLIAMLRKVSGVCVCTHVTRSTFFGFNVADCTTIPTATVNACCAVQLSITQHHPHCNGQTKHTHTREYSPHPRHAAARAINPRCRQTCAHSQVTPNSTVFSSFERFKRSALIDACRQPLSVSSSDCVAAKAQ